MTLYMSLALRYDDEQEDYHDHRICCRLMKPSFKEKKIAIGWLNCTSFAVPDKLKASFEHFK